MTSQRREMTDAQFEAMVGGVVAMLTQLSPREAFEIVTNVLIRLSALQSSTLVKFRELMEAIRVDLTANEHEAAFDFYPREAELESKARQKH